MPQRSLSTVSRVRAADDTPIAPDGSPGLRAALQFRESPQGTAQSGPRTEVRGFPALPRWGLP